MCVCVYVCVPVCMFFVPFAQPQFRADLHKMWYVAFLYPSDVQVGLASAARMLAQCVVYAPLQMTGELCRAIWN